MGIQPEKQRKRDMGESVFPETDPISLLFWFAYIPFVIHRDEYSQAGVSRPDPCHNQVLHIKLYKGLMGFTSSSGHEAADIL